MKTLILSFLFITFSGSAFASGSDYNQDCKTIYGRSARTLMSLIQEFNDEKLSPSDLGGQAILVNLDLKAMRASCYFAESPDNKSCVLKYKEVYQDLKEKISVLPMLLGNQKTVDLSYFEVLKTKTKLGVIDLQCNR